MPFGLNYHDYLANAPGLNASENAVQPMTEDEWNRLPMDQQWGLLGYGSQGINVNQFDNRYQGLLGDGVSGGDNNDINVHPGTFNSNTNNRGVQRFKDPSQIQQGQGYYATAGSNATADAQKQGGLSDAGWAALVASLFAGGAAAGGLAGGAVGAPAMETAVGGGFGTGALGAGGTGAAFGAGAGSAATAASGAGQGFDFSQHPYTGQFSGGPGVGSLGADFVPAGASGGAGSGGLLSGGYGDAGMIAPGMGNAAALDSSLINAGLPQLAGGALTGIASPAAWGGLAADAGSWALTHPLQAYGAGQTVAGLLGGGSSGGGGGGGGSSTSKSGNGTGVNSGFKADRPQFQPNPYLMAQLRAGGYIQ